MKINPFPFLIVLVIIIVLSVIDVAEARPNLPRDDNVVYYNWVAPGGNLTILDEFIQFHGFGDVDDIMMIEADGKNYSVEVGSRKDSDTFRFKLEDSRFDINKSGEMTSDGMPFFGKMKRGTDYKIYSFLLEVNLLRPILEFSRTVNGKMNKGSMTEIDIDTDEEADVYLEILNHGIDNTRFSHKEHFPENADIKINDYQGMEISIEDDHINMSGDTEERPSINYTLKFNENTDFTFDSIAELEYKNTTYIFEERNLTKIIADSGVDIKSGFYTGSRFREMNHTIEPGEYEEMGMIISNRKNEDIEGRIMLEFPEGERKIESVEEERRIMDNIFEREFTIENNSEKSFLFDVGYRMMGTYPINMVVEIERGERMIREDVTYFLITDFKPPIPKIASNDTRANMSIDMSLFLESKTDREVGETHLDVGLKGGGVDESISYKFQRLEMPEKFLINSISRFIEDPENFSIYVDGYTTTEYGEKVEFYNEMSLDEGFREDYKNFRSELMDANNLDERYEYIDIERHHSMGESFFVGIIGMVTGTDENDSRPILTGVVLFTFILGIQLMIYRKRRR